MKRLCTIATLSLSLALLPVLSAPDLAGAQAVETYTIDNAHTSAMFKVSHLGFSHTWGRFNDVSGSFVVDRGDASKSSVEITIQAESIDTNDEKRDKHLRNPDFFNTKQFPIVSFKSTSVKKLSETEYEVAGTFTMHGVSKPLTVKMVKLGEGKDPWGKTRMGFETSFTLKRSEFGMNYMPDGIGDEVTIYFSSEGIRS